MSQETVDIAFRQLPGMMVLVKLDEAANPMHVRFFRASAVMADPQNSDEVVVETGRGFSLEQPQRLRSLSSRQHGITLSVRTWPFPALEPLGMEGARTFVVRANALPKKRSILGAQNLPRLGSAGLIRNPTLASPPQGQRKRPRTCVSMGPFSRRPKLRLSWSLFAVCQAAERRTTCCRVETAIGTAKPTMLRTVPARKAGY